MSNLDQIRERIEAVSTDPSLCVTEGADDYWQAAADREWLDAEVARLRRTLLDIATEAGEDTSDIDHPDQLVQPSIEEFALTAVRHLREDYNDVLREGLDP